MSVNGSALSGQFQAPRSARPLLLPTNRRLRHLRGITVRNLSLDVPLRRTRGKTIDDDGLPSALNSPAKLQAIREIHNLGHSRSYSDLHASPAASDITLPDDKPSQRPNRAPKRPSLVKSRKSSFGWGTLGSKQRQDRLEEAVERHVADVFFSVHVAGQDEPVYISECQRAMNPNFRLFDFHTCVSDITRESDLAVKLWAKQLSASRWQCLLELHADLRSLHYIGTSLEDWHHPLPENCIIFHLTDGLYTSFTSSSLESSLPPSLSATQPTSKATLPTSSHDALTRLMTLTACISDALAARASLASEISALVSTSPDRFLLPTQLAASTDALAKTRRALTTERKQLRQTSAKIADLTASLAARRAAMAADRAARADLTTALPSARDGLAAHHAAHRTLLDAIAGQRRRICEDLATIYPIEPASTPSTSTSTSTSTPTAPPLSFTIRGLALPNSDFSTAPEDTTAAALGHAAQLTTQLAHYLSAPLPYPPTFRGSASTIRDPVGRLAGPAVFPLHARGQVFYRFEYGVFLLNKDVERVAARLDLRLLDIRQTLPGLKYILFVATAGKGEAPARRAGGVRGLGGGVLVGSREGSVMDESREGSVDGRARKDWPGGKELEEARAALRRL